MAKRGMRRGACVGLVSALAIALGSSSAHAAGGVSGRGETGGKGGLGPGSGPSGSNAGAGPVATGGAATNQVQNQDTTTQSKTETKAWEVGGVWETHRLIRQDDLEGAAVDKLFNVLGVYARYDLTSKDRIGIRDYFYERFIADAGETGLRADDVTLTYTRTEPLPKQFTFSGTLAVNAPTSFASQKMGLISSPALILQLDKKLGKYVTVSGRTVGTAFFEQDREAQGGNPNPKWRVGATLEGEVTMPFLEELSVGADIATGWVWYHDVSNNTPLAAVSSGTAQGGDGQPVQQSYGGEIFARYVFPSFVGIRSDFTLALAQGDPSLGYTSVLHDGVAYSYLFWRQSSEVYGALSIKY
jgi:hypothetical protein